MKSPALSLYAYKNFNRALKRTFKPYATYIVSVRISDKEKNMSEFTDNQTCPSVGYQAASICVPVTIEPYAKAGATKTKCCGNAVVVSGAQPCAGIKNGTCSFTISQNICVAVPVDFGANAVVGEAYVDCKGASATDICTDCANAFPEDKVEPLN